MRSYYTLSSAKGLGILILVLFSSLDYIYHKVVVSYLLVADLFRSHEIVFWLIVVSIAICCFWCLSYWLRRKKRRQRASIAKYGPSGFYKSPYWINISKKIRKRDDFTCQVCGIHGLKDGVELHVHHVKPRSLGGDERNSNLITLCKECHMSQPGHEFMRRR